MEVAVRAARQHIGGALDEAADNFAPVVGRPTVGRRHELVVGVEGDLQYPRTLLEKCGDVDSALLRQHHQRTLGGVSDHLTITQHSVRAERHREERVVQGRGRR